MNFRPPLLGLGIVLGAMLLATPALAAPIQAEPARDLQTALTLKGYENVAVAQQDDTLTVWFESRRHYSKNRAMGLVLTAAAQHHPHARLRVVPLVFQTPITCVEAQAKDITRWVGREIPDAELGNRLQFSAPLEPPRAMANNSAGRVDLQLLPAFDIYGRKGFSYLLIEKASATLLPGLSGLARTEISLSDPGASRWSYGVMRWGRWLFPNTMLTATAGSYSLGEWGGGLELAQYWDEGQTCLRLGVGDSTEVLPQSVLSVERYVPPLDCTFTVGYGRFMLGDSGPFVKAVRFFSRSFLEVDVFRTQFGNQLRFTLGINFGPDPLPDPGPLRVYGPGWIESEYRASRPLAGNTLWPEPNANDAVLRLLPAYVRSHVGEWRQE